MRWHRNFLACVLAVSCVTGSSWAVTDEEVGRAIDKIKKYLYEKQDPQSGNWEFRSRPGGLKRDRVQVGGETALVTLALMLSGESAQNPNIARAIKYLQDLEMGGTYAVSMRAHVWAQLPPQYLQFLEKDAQWLLEAASRHQLGLFDYQPVPSSYIDNSVTQYGILGLWEGSKRGISVPRRYWERWLDHFLKAQLPDGSWVYGASAAESIGGEGSGNIFDAPGTGAMTTTGLTTLLVAQEELYADRKAPEPKITAAIQKGMDWLDKNFDLDAGGGGYNHYYLYGVERVALASGVRYLKGMDWYKVGAEQIIREADKLQGSRQDYLKTSFALMFMARGRYPVWISKLEIPEIAWNNHPNDLHFVSLYLSDQREGEVNWQVVNINDASPDEWLMAPALYLASNDAVSLTAPQKRVIKQYIDKGGLLVTCADNDSAAFNNSIRQLVAELYPQYPVKRVEEKNRLLHSWQKLPNGDQMPIYTVSNGARELVIMPGFDWGYQVQSERHANQSNAWKFATNLFAYATDKGVLNNRLVRPFEARQERQSLGRMKIGRARYQGNWLPEPATWEVLSDFVFNHTGFSVTATPADGDGVLDLEDIGDSELKLIHLSGIEAVKLTPAELEAIQAYVKRGGTLLVENVGGQGGFSQGVLDQLSGLFKSPAVPLTGADAVISGEGLPGGFDCRRTLYRRYAVVTLNLEPVPRLAGFLDEKGRPTVIISHEDLSLGALGCRQWGILGYHPASARELMTNIILLASQQSVGKDD